MERGSLTFFKENASLQIQPCNANKRLDFLTEGKYSEIRKLYQEIKFPQRISFFKTYIQSYLKWYFPRGQTPNIYMSCFHFTFAFLVTGYHAVLIFR